MRNNINLPIEEVFDDFTVEIRQESTLSPVKVMAYYPPDVDMNAMYPDSIDDRVGNEEVTIQTAKELIVLLQEVLEGDFRRFNKNEGEVA